jgi:hypothetical protein
MFDGIYINPAANNNSQLIEREIVIVFFIIAVIFNDFNVRYANKNKNKNKSFSLLSIGNFSCIISSFERSRSRKKYKQTIKN